MRKEAAKRGLDPDKWFNNVEIVTAEKVGIETTTYVRNIFKYYTAYKLMLDLEETQKKARESVKQRDNNSRTSAHHRVRIAVRRITAWEDMNG